MAQSRAARKQQTRTAQQAPPVEAVAEAGPVWSPPLPRAISRLGAEQRKALEEVAATARKIERFRALVDDDVRRARDRGVSWAAIGLALGTSGEAARQRWGTDRAT